MSTWVDTHYEPFIILVMKYVVIPLLFIAVGVGLVHGAFKEALGWAIAGVLLQWLNTPRTAHAA